MKCEECGKESNDLIFGACKECADKIMQRIEKNAKTAKRSLYEF